MTEIEILDRHYTVSYDGREWALYHTRLSLFEDFYEIAWPGDVEFSPRMATDVLNAAFHSNHNE